MAFDDEKVRQYLRESEKAEGKSPKLQWSYLVEKRKHDDPDDDDDELAAAEHYMYARWQVGSGETNAAVMIGLTMGYDPMKLAGYIPIIYLARRIAGHTWSTPSVHSMEWGLRGCTDGMSDQK